MKKKVYIILSIISIVFLPSVVLASQSQVNMFDKIYDSALIMNNFFGNLDAVRCGNAEIPVQIPGIVRTIINIVKVVTPLALIIVGMIDMLKAVTASDEKKIKDAQNAFIRRLIPATLVFFVISIVQFIVSLVAPDSKSIVNCISCMIGSSENCIKVEKQSESNNNTDIAYISDIKTDGIIITVSAKSNNGVAGYYFSYNNKRPNKEKGGWVATSDKKIDVVRLPGTTYVWVEDESGKISNYKTVKITEDTVLGFVDKKYSTLSGTSLSDYLKSKKWSVDEYNKLIARSVRATGLFTKEATAVAALSLQGVLGQKYGIKLPYKSAGKYREFGVNPLWGKSSNSYNYGMDCSAFITWTYVQAGWEVKGLHPPYWNGWPTLDFNKNNGEIGDILVKNGEQGSRHVKLIIGKTDKAYIIAESSLGFTIGTHSYSSSNGYRIQKGENFSKLFGFVSESSYPTGF